MACWLYILKSETSGKTYVGITGQLRRRLAEHNGGYCRSTSAGRPWALIYHEKHASHDVAREREIFFKSGRGRAQIAAMFPLKPESAEGG